MDPLAARVLNYLEGEWHVIRRAPIALTIIVLIGLGIGWWFASMHYEGTIRSKEASVDAMEKQRDLALGQLGEIQSQRGKNDRKTRPYTISKEAEVEFIQTLSSAGRYEVVIEHVNGNNASLALARRMKAVLEGCWNIRSFDTTVIGGDSPTGVIIRANKENGTPLGASLL